MKTMVFRSERLNTRSGSQGTLSRHQTNQWSVADLPFFNAMVKASRRSFFLPRRVVPAREPEAQLSPGHQAGLGTRVFQTPTDTLVRNTMTRRTDSRTILQIDALFCFGYTVITSCHSFDLVKKSLGGA